MHLLQYTTSSEEAYLDKNCQRNLQHKGANNHHSQIISRDVRLYIQWDKASWRRASNDYDDPTEKLNRDNQEKLEVVWHIIFQEFYNVSKGKINDTKEKTNIQEEQ